jgi:hypothetical protein
MPRIRAPILALTAVLTFAIASPALAYDTGPHSELTRDAMGAEGFGTDAMGVAQVNNWFVDLYENSSKLPYSGHGGFWRRLLTGAIRSEHWRDDVVAAADRTHFDSSTTYLFNTAGVTHEWDRLRRAVWTIAREARDDNDPAKLLTVLGVSLHQVQDFYTHTNWIEPATGLSTEGPDWHARGFGSSPTWFDIPADQRDSVTIYTANTQGHYDRQHGSWNSDNNEDLFKNMNKDWPGRPLYLESAVTAYFASRQWIEAVRSWVADDSFWRRAQRYRANQRQLNHDLSGSFNISLYGGHWQGQGEPLGGEHGPGGSLLDLRSAIKNYFEGAFHFGTLSGRTEYRGRFEKLIRRIADPNAPGEPAPVPSSQALQRDTRIVVLRIPRYKSHGLGDPGPDDADMYARVRLDGQAMASSNIEGHDNFYFHRPNAPWTWIKAVPASTNEGEPVETMDIEVKTSGSLSSGTDDDVYLRVGPSLRFPLDKRLYDDFERGDRDTYSVPIDEATEHHFTVGDIRQVRIEKSKDGVGGGWKLGGVRLRVNGRVAYNNQHIDRWLENNHRTWTAPNFTRRSPRGNRIPVWLKLGEDDALYGGDDDGDINPFDHRRTVLVGYPLNDVIEERTRGGARFGGRLGDGDEAEIIYKLETITPELPVAPPPPPPPPGPKADLIITDFQLDHITVKNQGLGAAGPFRVAMDATTESHHESFAGLAPGASETRSFFLGCHGWNAFVDDLNQVPETDETNNTTGLTEAPIC